VLLGADQKIADVVPKPLPVVVGTVIKSKKQLELF
jgi:hypothetical protein